MTATNEPNYLTDWTTKYVKDWIRWLAEWKGRDGVRALEIGCHEGRSSRWFCENILTGKNCRLDCIDAWVGCKNGQGEAVGIYAGAEPRFDHNTAGLSIRKLKGDSVVELAKLLVVNERYSLVYVDAGHHAESCLCDLALGWRMTCKTGVLIADDYNLSGRHLRIPPWVAIDGWLATVADSMDGFEITQNQVAVWKRS